MYDYGNDESEPPHRIGGSHYHDRLLGADEQAEGRACLAATDPGIFVLAHAGWPQSDHRSLPNGRGD